MADNHTTSQARLSFIHKLLHEHLNTKATQILPIQYDPQSPFQYNNFIYHITLASPPENGPPQQPGTTPLPSNTKALIVRLTNPHASGMHPHTRVENEVAMLTLAAAALAHFTPRIVPAVYGWGTASGSAQGWIMQELMPGSPLDESFGGMGAVEREGVLGQVAAILGALQGFRVPESIRGHGGVTFDGAGQIVSSSMASVGGGPWPSYEAYFKDRLRRALEEADGNRYIKGWRANGVRGRLEGFVERGVAVQFEGLESRDEKVIVHADFTPSNMLYDASTQRITALLDYDFACVLHPSYEFLRSFGGAGGQLEGWSDAESSEQAALRDAKLHGFPSPLPENVEGGVQWDVAAAWEKELEKINVKRPRTMRGIDRVADVDAVLGFILPWRITNSDVLQLQSEEVILKCREENEVQLVKLLDHMRF
ncbi:hypothetical protein BS50DRAFT_640275 [Corynespora cassiicola Philippines]|uniref:Aminoglycoside phosphotransferase domain-containing protein n=1 Tax=Corynespora cassiicola Philippines TaxID=1448308 RepID=A0A2T2N443_CORCC|nr:hypothetical protein BS50DRAFT_640275 [Corynespora cassiicola Philippines]